MYQTQKQMIMLKISIFLWITFMLIPVILSLRDDSETWDNDRMHPKFKPATNKPNPGHQNDFVNPPGDRIKTDWYELDKKRIDEAMLRTTRLIQLNHPTKNVILFMGDGLGVSTMSAARVYMAQSRNLTGEDAQLSWERMPHTALSKTYSTDFATADSAATATAMLGGEKTISDVVSCNQETILSNCSSCLGNEVKSMLHYAIEDNKWTGVVTTARITHASPAATYSHSADRDWEADSDLTEEAVTNGCKDIAAQLIDQEINHNIRVILGGGRENMIPNDQPDTEYPSETGKREDGRDLIKAWQDIKAAAGFTDDQYKYVDNITDFEGVDENTIEYLMGLFELDHMQYELDREEDVFGEPSLAEMVEKAIKILQRAPDGYFLFVESGRIDHAHHDNLARRALHDTMVMSDAVQKVLDLTSEEDTLLVVTADHSHAFTLQGYAESDTDILSFDEHTLGSDGKPYTLLGYTNGPGYDEHRRDPPNEDGVEVPRFNLTEIKNNITHKDYKTDSGIPRSSETHAGEDVVIFARGPMAHMFHGTQEQSYIGNMMMYASCLGKNTDLCATSTDVCLALVGHASSLTTNIVHMLSMMSLLIYAAKCIGPV